MRKDISEPSYDEEARELNKAEHEEEFERTLSGQIKIILELQSKLVKVWKERDVVCDQTQCWKLGKGLD